MSEGTGRRAAWAVAAVTTVFLGLVAWGGFEILTGPPSWHWRHRVLPLRPVLLWPVAGAALLAWAALAAGRARSWLRAALLLALLHWHLQLGLIAAYPMGAARVPFSVIHPGITTYHTEALLVDDAGDLVRNFPERMRRFRVHAVSSPPGAILLYRAFNHAVGGERADAWARGLARRGLAPPMAPWADPDAVAEDARARGGPGLRAPRGMTAGAFVGAFLLGHLLTLLGSLSVVTTAAAVRRIWGTGAAMAALPFLPLIPSVTLVHASLDQLYVFWIPVVVLAAARALGAGGDREAARPGGSAAWGALAGLAFFAGLFVTFTFLVVPVGIAAYAGWAALAAAHARLAAAVRHLAAWTWERRGPILAGLAAVVVPFVLLRVLAGFDVVETFRVADEQSYREQVVRLGREYRTWLFWNLYDFAFLLGWPLAALLAARAWREGRAIAAGATDAAPLALAMATVLAFLDLSGKTLGETGRIWMFLMPWSAAAAGWHAEGAWRALRAPAIVLSAAAPVLLRIFVDVP